MSHEIDEKGKIPGKDLGEIVDKTFLNISFVYADQYKKDPDLFLKMFLTYQSVRTNCAWMVQSYKHMKVFDQCRQTGKDFTEWANKQEGISADQQRLLAETLLILYSITQPTIARTAEKKEE